MNKRPGAIAVVAAAAAAVGGLFATPSHSAGNPPNCDPIFGCPVYLTGTGPSPATVTIDAMEYVRFYNGDSVPHTVVFANGLCSLTVPPEQSERWQGVACASRFSSFVGSYAYMEDGESPGNEITTPLPRSVSLTARTHTIRGGTRLTLRGVVTRSNTGSAPPPPVVVLARRNSKQAFEPVATVRTRGSHQTKYGWTFAVEPKAATTYIAEVTAQRLCYYPASRCAQPQGQVWANAKSRPFTVRVRPSSLP